MAWSDAARAAAVEARKRNSQGKKIPVKTLDSLADKYIKATIYGGTSRGHARAQLTYFKALSAKSGVSLAKVTRSMTKDSMRPKTAKSLTKMARG
jgi:hypothetical protein